jgi:hypothetical protein
MGERNSPEGLLPKAEAFHIIEGEDVPVTLILLQKIGFVLPKFNRLLSRIG